MLSLTKLIPDAARFASVIVLLLLFAGVVGTPCAAQSFSIFTDPQSGAKLELPESVWNSARKTANGYNWRTPRGHLNVDLLNFGNKRTIDDLYKALKKRPGRRFSLDDFSSTGFLLSGADRDRTRFFIRVQMARTSPWDFVILGLSIVYSTRDDGLTKIADRIRRSLRFDDDDLVASERLGELRKIAHDVSGDTEKAKLHWAAFAIAARRLRFRVGLNATNSMIDEILDSYSDSPLSSKIWGVLPSGIIQSLSENTYTTNHIYGAESEYPQVRQETVRFVQKNPNDKFAFAAYFAVGDFGNALKTNKLGIAQGMIHYAFAHKNLSAVLSRINERLAAVQQISMSNNSDDRVRLCANPLNGTKCRFYEKYTLHNGDEADRLRTFLRRTEYATPALVRSALQRHSQEVASIKAHLEAAAKMAGAPHSDDAYFLRGVLEYADGDVDRAVGLFEQSVAIRTKYGWLDDYGLASLRRLIVILERLPRDRREKIVTSSDTFGKIPALWYVLARASYREFDYRHTVDLANQGLERFSIPAWRMPASTSTQKLEAEIKRLLGKDKDYYPDTNLLELAYLLNASREFLGFDSLLADAVAKPLDSELSGRVISTVLKYSLLTASENEREQIYEGTLLQHRDLRQAIHLCEVAIAKLRTGSHPKLKELSEWLHYRRIRALAIFKPDAVERAVIEFEAEHPDSKLIDDAYVENLYAVVAGSKEPAAAKRAFEIAKAKAAGGNSLDNAYSWYAIYLRCVGRESEARSVNLEIITRFKLTRHAIHAVKRLAQPTGCSIEGF